MYTNLSRLCIPKGSLIRDAIARMDENKTGIVLVILSDGKLSGTITDGDIRRAMMANVDVNAPVSTLITLKSGTSFAEPITGRASDSPETHLKLMEDHRVLHLPVLDDRGRVMGLVTHEEFGTHTPLRQAVVMAGGAGTRLLPLTDETPKPMLPVGDRPLLEIIVERLREAGIQRVYVTTHHKQEQISDHFGNGQEFGVEILYVNEDRPLGTAGALALMEKPTETMLVINGDILTGLDVRRLLSFHREQHADLTVAVRQYDIQVPYGVLECDGASVQKLTEKPLVKFYVNAGIYLLEPGVYRFIPEGEPFDMTDLIQRLLAAGWPVCSFPIREYWLDIGQHSDYEKAQEHIKDQVRETERQS